MYTYTYLVNNARVREPRFTSMHAIPACRMYIDIYVYVYVKM